MSLSCPRGSGAARCEGAGALGCRCGVAITASSAICPGPPACRCSPLGAASAQCHENSTCVCRPGFVGYKCDHCQDNFFPTAGGTYCQQCPSCYTLVKEEVSPPLPRSAPPLFIAHPQEVPALCWAPGNAHLSTDLQPPGATGHLLLVPAPPTPAI